MSKEQRASKGVMSFDAVDRALRDEVRALTSERKILWEQKAELVAELRTANEHIKEFAGIDLVEMRNARNREKQDIKDLTAKARMLEVNNSRMTKRAREDQSHISAQAEEIKNLRQKVYNFGQQAKGQKSSATTAKKELKRTKKKLHKLEKRS